jgi:hypothetical protein
MSSQIKYLLLIVALFSLVTACKTKKKMQKYDQPVVKAPEDTVAGHCRLDFKNARALSRYMKESELKFKWLFAKANVESVIDQKEESFDIRVSIRKDSAMLVTIQYLLGLQVAKALITRDSVKFVNYIEKTYFVGDFNYINEALHADLDYEVVQAVFVGNSAEFHDDDSRLKPVTDRIACKYLLSTARKKRLRRIQQGSLETRDALQTLTLNPENFKILRNEFYDPTTNRRFTADYSNFAQTDSVFAPRRVNIDIVAEKKASVKIEYVRMEKNSPQKLTLNIPGKYDQITIRKTENKKDK